jgi:hypothetical protein
VATFSLAFFLLSDAYFLTFFIYSSKR